ncbi:MAG: molybdenum cofactor guanylyltransferase [bacterium]|nr:molybdenum cofactor guanylyltransferase [bacterium]
MELTDTTAILLAGGKSSRLGQNKAFVDVANKTIFEREFDVLQKLFSEIIIIANNPVLFRSSGLKIYKDIIPDKGPLGGILTGLSISETKNNFVVSCDLPFLNENVISFLYSKFSSCNLLIPCWQGQLMPLHGFYSKNCLPVIENQISTNKLKVLDITSHLKTKYVQELELKKYDREGKSFFNVNTLEDLENARIMARTIKKIIS